MHREARAYGAVIVGAGVGGPVAARLRIAGCARRRRMTRRSIRGVDCPSSCSRGKLAAELTAGELAC